MSLAIGLMLLSSCEKSLMSFEGEDTLYFDVRRGAAWISPSRWAHQFYSTVEFGNIAGDVDTLAIKVMSTGTPKSYDRPFEVTINKDSTTATEGSDFELVKDNYAIKANQDSAVVRVVFNRTNHIDNDTVKLQLQLHENEYFKLGFNNFDEDGHYSPDQNLSFDYNRDASIHNIFIYDVLIRPSTWMGNDVTGFGLFGKYSIKKYRLMMKITNTTIQDFSSSATMPSARATAICEKMSLYLLDKAKAKEPVLDEDGTMMYFMYVQQLGGSAGWKPFTKPEDYYK
jgi:hypothetical protein